MKCKKVVVLLVLLLIGCATGPKNKDDDFSYTRIFHRGYEDTWKVLLQIIEDEFMLPVKEKNEQRGLITTGWISVIRIRGTLRWNVKIILNRVEEGTQVKLYDRVEEPSTVLGKLKNKRGEMKTGWVVSESKVPDLDALKEKISLRLGEQPLEKTN